MVAQDSGNFAFLDFLHTLRRFRAVSNHVAQAKDLIAAHFVQMLQDSRQGIEIGMEIANER